MGVDPLGSRRSEHCAAFLALLLLLLLFHLDTNNTAALCSTRFFSYYYYTSRRPNWIVMTGFVTEKVVVDAISQGDLAFRTTLPYKNMSDD